MESSSSRPQMRSRAKSIMSVETNILRDGGDVSMATMKVESLADTELINPEAFNALYKQLAAFE
jgi:hypothetical protein